MQQAGALLSFFISIVFLVFFGEEQIQPSLAASGFAAAHGMQLIP